MTDISATVTATHATQHEAAPTVPPPGNADPALFAQLMNLLAGPTDAQAAAESGTAVPAQLLGAIAPLSADELPPADRLTQTETPPADAALVAALVGQMQAAYARPTLNLAATETGMSMTAVPPDPTAAPVALMGDRIPQAPADPAIDLAIPATTSRITTNQSDAPGIQNAFPMTVGANAQPASSATLPTLPENAVEDKNGGTNQVVPSRRNAALVQSSNSLQSALAATTANDHKEAVPAIVLPTAPTGAVDSLQDASVPQTTAPNAPSTASKPAAQRVTSPAIESTAALHRPPQTATQPAFDNLLSADGTMDAAAVVAAMESTPAGAMTRARNLSRPDMPDTVSALQTTPATISSAALGTTGMTDAAPQLHLTPHLDAPEWKSAFAGGVRLLLQEGANSASLQLNPADLGPIDVRIQMFDQRADIAFVVKTPEANSAIQSALSELREQLARSGVELGQTSVGGQREHAQQFAHTPSRGHASAGPGTPDARGVTSGSPPAPRPRSSGRIDTFA